MPARKRILIVESDLATQWMYQRALQEDYQVLVASTQEQAIALLKDNPVHAIVLEPGLVDRRGWDLFAELKQRPETSTTPVILCTTQDERRRGLEMGAAAYLVKPVLPAALLETVRRLTAPLNSEGELP